ncbi:MAG: phosphoribosylformylglycinamidine synthase [Treponema sp.]|nr:phosphoribosylformylglycinamidine synthase [Treponema sp.]
MFRLYIERKTGFENEAKRYLADIVDFLGISALVGVRYLNRYDVENVSEGVAQVAATRIFSEPQSDFFVTDEASVNYDKAPALRRCCCFDGDDEVGSTAKSVAHHVIAWEYLPGQYDQRSDSAEQCLRLLREGLSKTIAVNTNPPIVRCAKILVLYGDLSESDLKKIKEYVINPVDSRLASLEIPKTLVMNVAQPEDIPVVAGFINWNAQELEAYRVKMGLAMDALDIAFLQDYFKGKQRDPSETEIRVLDTYWSDHCRHTTFLTELEHITVEDGPYKKVIEESLAQYKALHADIYADRTDKPLTLMDMATIGAKYLRKHGKLEDLEQSEENNACSIYMDVHYTTDASGKPLAADSPDATERWLLMFKNETHNHPTEIEPFGGAATCIGGAIRDPLSGRSWVYQAMRISGAADPRVPVSETLEGKLPQIKLVREAAQGYSSYGNQIGLTTGQVVEIYHPGYVAKRMELGAVIAAAPLDIVVRERPAKGDVVILLGGGTGRDGIGGATGSSKIHTQSSVTTAAAEVQKGNAVEERKIQRLFRNKQVSLMIKRCNDFGAGGVSVAIGELAPGLDINLDAVPKKYDGLNGTELAISESQERMAVVVDPKDVDAFIQAAAAENLNAVVVASVTDTDRLVMKWRGKVIVDLDRSFLDAAGARHIADAVIANPAAPEESPLVKPLETVGEQLDGFGNDQSPWLTNMRDLACCSQKGLGERFDGSIGSASVLFPYGGNTQNTPESGMVAKIPVVSPRETSTVSMMTYGFDPRVSQWSPWHGAQVAVLSSLAKITCLGGDASTARLTFQEFFGRAVDTKTWGYPAAALLGAIDAQVKMGTGSIGGKDSMSGSFGKMNVPHTLVSFAVTHDDVKHVVSGAFKKPCDDIYIVTVPYSKELVPDFAVFAQNNKALYALNDQGKIQAMYPVSAGGIAEAIAKMCLGNALGAYISDVPVSCTMANRKGEKARHSDLFTPLYGSIIVETSEDLTKNTAFAAGTVYKLGCTIPAHVIETPFDDPILLDDIELAWSIGLGGTFPISSDTDGDPLPEWAVKPHQSLEAVRKNPVFKTGNAAPSVLIPVFPGTNCEYDMARAFNLAGAKTKIVVFANNTQQALIDSLDRLAKELRETQILAIPGGFSAGDEPDGSGKFIANVLREGRIAQEITNLLEKRDGLILGICNGFQALIKTGLVPYGKIMEPSEELPTLTYNTIGHHLSRIVRTKMVSAMSPWALHPSVIDERMHLVPISHGEGRVIIKEDLAKQLFAQGQVFSQYADTNGMVTTDEPGNPNGSYYAIEGLTSPDGRVLGKMGHSERTMGTGPLGSSKDLLMNVAGDPMTNPLGNSCQNIFAAGVNYFN